MADIKVGKPVPKSAMYQSLAEATGLSRKQIASVFDELTNLIKRDVGKKGPGVFALPGLLKIKRVSKPGLRVYTQKREIPRVYGGLGVAILSTPGGVMTGNEARRRNMGGEILCYVW